MVFGNRASATPWIVNGHDVHGRGEMNYERYGEQDNQPSSQRRPVSLEAPSGATSRQTGRRHDATRYRLTGYLVSGRTVIIEDGGGRGSPFEKWIVATATNAATMRTKTTV